MALTKLDPVAALVVIDLQKGIVGMPVPTAHPVSEIVARAAKLAHAFRERGLPVVWVNVNGRAPGRVEAARPDPGGLPMDWAELAPELGVEASDHRVTKQRFGAFLGTGLDEYLRGRRVTQIVLAGISTSLGVESTARSAYDLGYHVVFATDGMTDRDSEAHKHSIERVFRRIGETDTTDNILAMLRRTEP